MPSYQWTIEQEQYLRKNYMAKSHKEMCAEIGVNPSTIQRKIKAMGLPTKPTGRGTKLTDEVKEYLLANYNHKTNKAMGEDLDLTKNTIRLYLDALGLVKVKNEEYEPKHKEIQVVIQYDNKGATGCKVLTVNETSYKRAKRRALDLAVNYMKYKKVRVIDERT